MLIRRKIRKLTGRTRWAYVAAMVDGRQGLICKYTDNPAKAMRFTGNWDFCGAFSSSRETEYVPMPQA